MRWYKPIHRKEGTCREQRSFLVARAQIVRSATCLINTIRGMFKANGVVLARGGDGRVFARIVRDSIKMLPELVQSSVTQLLIRWIQLHRSETKMYRALAKIAHQDGAVSLFMTVPGVGAATAVGFASTITTHTRFSDQKKVASYLGLAPKVYQSGDTNYHGHITKKGDLLLRWLLTETAGVILTRIKEPFALCEWGLRLVEKKRFG